MGHLCQETLRDMKNQNIYKQLAVSITVLFMVGCQATSISTDGVFAKNSKNLTQSLVGKWEITSEADPAQGVVLYEFYKGEGKSISLKVRGEEKTILDFNSQSLNNFSFVYPEGDKSVLVVGQFESGNRSKLVCIQEEQTQQGANSKLVKLERKIAIDPAISASVKKK